MINDDDVPPLEDMSAFLVKPPALVKQSTLVKTDLKDTVSPTQDIRKTEATFSGLKKGFFDSKSPKSAIVQKKKDHHIPLIKPKKDAKNPLVFDQVQNVIQQNNSEWMTPDLLEKIEKSPTLSKAFQDPLFTVALSEMSSNPSNALKKYQKERPDLIHALKEFASIMGNQFAKSTMAQIPKDLEKHEQKILDNVFSNSEVQDALKDEQIQKILADSTKDPLALSRALYNGSPQIKKNIQLLFQAGILSSSM